MSQSVIEEKSFDRIDFAKNALPKGEYENCKFVNCDFSTADLSDMCFSECEFKGCNLSMAKLNKTSLRDVTFKDCKLLGLHFETCNEFLFSVYFENCSLNLSSFYKRHLAKTKFIHVSLHDVDFTEANLTGSVFDNCDLMRASFEHTNLEKVNFRTSYNYSIDPEINRIKKAKFSLTGIVGLLQKYDIEIS